MEGLHQRYEEQKYLHVSKILSRASTRTWRQMITINTVKPRQNGRHFADNFWK